MTGCTIVGVYSGVVKSYTREAGEANMTGRTIQRSRYMGRIDLRILANSNQAVVARCTIRGNHRSMVKGCRHERDSTMTDATVFPGRQVVYALADTDVIVVAGGTGLQVKGEIVAEEPTHKCARGMAGVTVFGGWEVTSDLVIFSNYGRTINMT